MSAIGTVSIAMSGKTGSLLELRGSKGLEITGPKRCWYQLESQKGVFLLTGNNSLRKISPRLSMVKLKFLWCTTKMNVVVCRVGLNAKKRRDWLNTR